ncbi:hypothetical protein [Tabrizicola sp.]|uniref:hypothetical protein n=1 Tax=Tabrizicola sp. TaxID=2005166 RepID=UPI003D2998D1
MRFLRAACLLLGVGLGLMACQTNDLAEPPAPLGDFALGHNIVVTSNMQKVAISRNASGEDWEAALEKAIDQRFGRYQGEKLYNIGVSIDAFALAPPGVPLVLNPKSALGITVTIWDDAAQKKLNEEGKQIIVMEKMSGETVLGSGLTQSAAKQMEILSYNAAKAIEGWLLENPEWFGLPPKAETTGPAPTTFGATAPSAAPAAATAAAPITVEPVTTLTE